MSDTEVASDGMTAADTKFLIACLRNSIGGSVQVDNKAVAESEGFSNVKSVANKIAVLRKKYNLPLGGKVVNSDGGGAPTTPSKAKPAKVIKKTPKAAAKPRKTPIKKSVKKEEESTEEADEEMEETDDAEVETLKVKADDDEDVA